MDKTNCTEIYKHKTGHARLEFANFMTFRAGHWCCMHCAACHMNVDVALWRKQPVCFWFVEGLKKYCTVVLIDDWKICSFLSVHSLQRRPQLCCSTGGWLLFCCLAKHSRVIDRNNEGEALEVEALEWSWNVLPGQNVAWLCDQSYRHWQMYLKSTSKQDAVGSMVGNKVDQTVANQSNLAQREWLSAWTYCGTYKKAKI